MLLEWRIEKKSIINIIINKSIPYCFVKTHQTNTEPVHVMASRWQSLHRRDETLESSTRQGESLRPVAVEQTQRL